MNILPFIFSFLIIFALIFNYASDRRASTALYRLALNKWVQSIHQGFTNQASTEFKRVPSNPTETPPLPQSEKIVPIDAKNSSYFRENKCCYEENKLNLTTFTAPEVSPQDYPYRVAVRLIKALYQHAPFYQENLEVQIVNALLTRDKKPLRDLFQHDPHLDGVFYKMLKGTSTYVVGTNQGYPALTDYCSFTANDNQLHFVYLSRPVLEALLGSSLMQTIEKAEKENNKSLTEKTFTPLLEAGLNSEVDKTYLDKTLRFGKIKKGAQTASVDDNNEMIIR